MTASRACCPRERPSRSEGVERKRAGKARPPQADCLLPVAVWRIGGLTPRAVEKFQVSGFTKHMNLESASGGNLEL